MFLSCPKSTRRNRLIVGALLPTGRHVLLRNKGGCVAIASSSANFFLRGSPFHLCLAEKVAIASSSARFFLPTAGLFTPPTSVPASSPRFIAKAHERGADAVILDLEDSVLPAEKSAARQRLAEAVPVVGQKGAKVFVRVNSEDEYLAQDLEAACRAGVFGVILPKAKGAAAVERAAAILDHVECEIGRAAQTVMLCAIEDPNAVFEARAIGAASPRVLGLMCASEDLPTSMGAEATSEFLRFPKLLVHFAAKAAGVRSFGLLRSIADFADLDAVAKAVEEARSFGFDGAICVHPTVVPLLNRGFAPPEEKAAKARRLLVAFEEAQKAGKGAFMFEGKMADEPVIQRARTLLEKYERLKTRDRA